MLSLTTWIWIIKTVLHSNLSKSRLRAIILEKCLLSQKKFHGAYRVDSQKIWDIVISNDENCCTKMKELNINSLSGLLSYYDEIQYKKMRRTYPRNRHRRGA